MWVWTLIMSWFLGMSACWQCSVASAVNVKNYQLLSPPLPLLSASILLFLPTPPLPSVPPLPPPFSLLLLLLQVNLSLQFSTQMCILLVQCVCLSWTRTKTGDQLWPLNRCSAVSVLVGVVHDNKEWVCMCLTLSGHLYCTDNTIDHLLQHHHVGGLGTCTCNIVAIWQYW